jgi:hypothetical protein
LLLIPADQGAQPEDHPDDSDRNRQGNRQVEIDGQHPIAGFGSSQRSALRMSPVRS